MPVGRMTARITSRADPHPQRGADGRIQTGHREAAEIAGKLGQSPARVVRRDAPPRTAPASKRPASGYSSGTAHDVLHRTDGVDPASPNQHDRRGQAGDLCDGMADIDDRHSRLVAQPFEVRQDFILSPVIEGCQRLIPQQQPRARQQRAADRDALLFAAREPPGPAIEPCSDAEEIDHIVEVGDAPFPSRGEPAAKKQVLSDGEVREKPALLEDAPDPPSMRRDADRALGIERNRAVHGDASPARTEQTGDRVYDGSLAGSRTAEQRGRAASGSKVDVEREIGEAVLDIDFEHGFSRRKDGFVEKSAERSVRTEQKQQQVTGHDRWHHERQVNHAVEQALAVKPAARQNDCRGQPKGQAADHCPERDAQAQAHRLYFGALKSSIRLARRSRSRCIARKGPSGETGPWSQQLGLW